MMSQGTTLLLLLFVATFCLVFPVAWADVAETTTVATNGTAEEDDNSTVTWPLTINPSTLEDWNRQDKEDMLAGIAMGAGAMGGAVVFAIVIICIFCRVKIDRHKKYLEKVAEAKKQFEMKTKLHRLRQRAPGISNDLVTGYTGGIRETWDPFTA